ncbi:MAG: hypothetical protein U9R01_07045 [candidate division WOR-3 bacterium]|nr:hypothetical protein [candidate division WOR-3 bacterium]
MARITGILDEVQIFDSTSTDITADVGHINTASYGLDHKTKQYPSIGGGASYVELIDDFVDIKTSLSIHPLSGTGFNGVAQLFGTITTDVTWSWAWPDTLPEFKINASLISGEYAELTNVKFGSWSIKASKGNPVEVTLDGLAKNFKIVAGTATNTPPATSRLVYLDGYGKIDGTAVGSIDNISIDGSRGLEAVRGIESTAAGSRRLPSEIIEKMKDISFSATIEITDDLAYQKALGDSALPYEIVDTRANIALDMYLNSQVKIALTNCAIQTLDHGKSADAEIRTVDIKGIATGITMAEIAA